jgi:hypothetical protein
MSPRGVRSVPGTMPSGRSDTSRLTSWHWLTGTPVDSRRWREVEGLLRGEPEAGAVLAEHHARAADHQAIAWMAAQTAEQEHGVGVVRVAVDSESRLVVVGPTLIDAEALG